MTGSGITERPVTGLLPGGSRSAPGAARRVVAVEEPLEIRVAGEPLAVTMRTPGDDARLTVGFLFAEGIIRSIEDLGAIAHCGRPGDEGYGNVIEVTAAPGVVLEVDRVAATRRGALTTSACGVCGRRSIDDLIAACGVLDDGPAVSSEVLASSTERLASAQTNFPATGGCHAAALLAADGTLLAAAEDVGRHNAVDKVIGALLYQRAVGVRKSAVGPAAAILAVSGRASFEIIQKAAMARIPIVASVSAATSLAIDLAERSRVTLVAFVRGRDLTIFSRPERITPFTPSVAPPGA